MVVKRNVSMYPPLPLYVKEKVNALNFFFKLIKPCILKRYFVRSVGENLLMSFITNVQFGSFGLDVPFWER